MSSNRDHAVDRVARHKWRRKYPVRSLIRSARKRGVDCDLQECGIVIPTHCPVLGIPLFIGDRVAKDNSPTLDRVDVTKGYVKGNVYVISWRANRLKSDATLVEVKAIYQYMRRHIK